MEVITQNFLYNLGTKTKNVANFHHVTKSPPIFGHQISKVDGVLWPKYNVRKQCKDQMKFEYWGWEIEFGKGDAENTGVSRRHSTCQTLASPYAHDPIGKRLSCNRVSPP